MSNKNILRPSTVYRRLPILKLVDEEVKILLISISDMITSNFNNNKNYVNISLPITFNNLDVSTISHTDIKRLIYYKIIEELEEKGYEVKLQCNETSTVLFIKWKISIEDEIEKIKKKLNDI